MKTLYEQHGRVLLAYAVSLLPDRAASEDVLHLTNARVLRSIPMLDQAAIDAVLQWVYEPTLLNGVPVEVEMDAYINFTLR